MLWPRAQLWSCMDARRAVLRTVPVLRRLVSPKLASSAAKRLYLAEAMQAHQIEVVFDVGANVGQFALGLRDMGYKGRILSFEPLDDAWQELSAHAAGDDKWDVFNVALGDTEGEADFAVMRYNVFSSLHAPALTQPYGEDNVVTGYRKVTVRRLDSLVDELSFGRF